MKFESRGARLLFNGVLSILFFFDFVDGLTLCLTCHLKTVLSTQSIILHAAWPSGTAIHINTLVSGLNCG